MAPRSATEEMAALAVETSDTTATEAEVAPQEPQNSSRPLKLAGAVGAAALAAGAVAAVMSGHAAPFSLQQAGGGGVTALQQSRTFKVGIGCTNWKMKFQEAQLCSADDCWDLCATTAGCKAMNFQGFDNEFCGVGGGKEMGTCYLYGCDCQETDNSCWTLGIMPATGGSGGVAGGTGGATGGIGGATGGTGGAAPPSTTPVTTSIGFPVAPSSTTLAGTVTGNLEFISGGTKAEVETAVGETLVDVLGLQPSQVTVEAMGARRLSFGPQVMGPRRLFLPWIVSFTIQVVDAVATAAAELVDKVEAIVKDPTALADELGQKLPDLEPETLAVAVADASGEIPAFTSTAPASQKCSTIHENCQATGCCAEPNTYCYEKNEDWAGCRPSCNVGIHEHDPVEYQTPWSCTVLDSDPSTPAAIDSPEPSAPNCAGIEENCMQSQCCGDPGFFCYEKDEHWAGCRPNCNIGIHQDDPAGHRTPWSCTKLDKNAAQQPDATRSGCSDVTTSCLETMCCEDENEFCYKKNDYWAACRPDCNIGIHADDPPEHQTEWTCEVLDPSPDAPPPINEAAPPTNCAGQYVDCSAAKCCSEAGEWCYKKNDYWSQCLPKCITGISPHDKFPHNTPWSCEPNDLDTENIPPAIPGAMPTTTAAPDSGTDAN